MNSLRSHALAWLTCICIGTTLVILASFVYHNYRHMRSTQKSEMKTLAKSILGDLAKGGDPLAGNDYSAILQKYRYTDLRDRLHFAVFTKDKQLLFKSPKFESGLTTHLFDSAERSQLYLISVKSNPGFHHLLSEWHFLLRYEKGEYIVFASSTDKYEVVEAVQNGLILALLAGMAFIIPTGIFIKKKILLPLTAIDDTVQRVKMGELDQRIPTLTSRDELTELAESMNATFMELEASFQRLQRFSSDAAHELRTPLTSIRGSIEVCLMKDRSDDDYRETLGECLDEVMLLSTIVENLLLLSSPGSWTGKNFETVLFNDVVLQAIDNLDQLPEYKNHRFSIQLNCDASFGGNQPLLMRLCYNLIHNALKYSEDGTEIEIRTDCTDDCIVFTVTDQGSGIPEAEFGQIFDRFYQSDRSHSEGVGLGLSIVKWIAELHNGTVAVSSTPGEGSSFTTTFPIK